MKISIVQGNNVLRSYYHKNKTYIEAPPAGDYIVRLSNDSPQRRLAVVSVDGINVIDGTDAGYSGPGYVLAPWQVLEIPGWRRDDKAVAAFTFDRASKSYAEKTGRGSKNIGVVGVAVFDERVLPLNITPTWPLFQPFNPWPTYPTIPYMTFGAANTGDGVYSCSVGPATKGVASTRDSAEISSEIANVGTAYGKETTFHTADVVFERASTSPAYVVELRYATRKQLQKWGVRVSEEEVESEPNAFPASKGVGCPAPEGWRG